MKRPHSSKRLNITCNEMSPVTKGPLAKNITCHETSLATNKTSPRQNIPCRETSSPTKPPLDKTYPVTKRAATQNYPLP